MPARILIVGLDSAEPDLVRAWAAEGRLPNLQRLLVAGDGRDVRNLPGFGNGVFWPCIHTGADPSFHGGYYLRQARPPTYAIEPFTKHDYLLPPFWRTLEDEGLDVAIIDPVEAPIGRLKRGIEILDWNVHRREEPPQSNPPGLIARLIEQYGDNPFHGNIDRMVIDGLSPESLSALSDVRIRNKTQAALELLDDRQWDLFMITFADPHDIGHRAWHLHDRAMDEAPEGTLDDPLRRCYEHLDTALGELMQKRTGEGQTIVVMGPGMERNITGRLLLPDMLRAFQGLKPKRLKQALGRVSAALTNAKLLPWALRDRVRTQRVRVATESRARDGHRYFVVPHNDDASAIRISLAGREAYGRVLPEAYDATCDELVDRFAELKDASGDRRAVSEVIRIRQHYCGPEVDRLPDLLVVWNREADLTSIRSAEFGVFTKSADTMRTGDHSRRGLLLSDRELEAAPPGPLNPMQVTPTLVGAVRQRAALASRAALPA
jgi:predicted AlkP superfamily phosphohydrolase/phosphomutase